MKNQNNKTAIMFLAVVWITFLLVVGYGLAKDAMNLADPNSFKLYKLELEELRDGNS